VDGLRRVRLERAHRQLQTADPAAGMTVAETARRWGWANQSKFAAAYRAQYGVTPATHSADEPADPTARSGWRASWHLRIPPGRGFLMSSRSAGSGALRAPLMIVKKLLTTSA
jgi:AraC-like DNA-binding protein